MVAAQALEVDALLRRGLYDGELALCFGKVS
jgi:hypothetical protein